MSRWTVEITTHPGMAADDDAVATIHDRLIADARVLGPALSWDLDTRAVSVSFQVEAEDFIGAVIRAAGAMTDAVGRPDHAADFQIQTGDVPVA
jgi:hypothetical protein